jgi:hypothetical protein
MRERLVTLLLAAGALLAFYALWLRPAPSLDDADVARPTTSERRGDGYAALFDWLQRTGVDAHSLRERYSVLETEDAPKRGNLLVLTLPGVEAFRSEELGALDRWVRRGNTLLIIAALLDEPGWAARRSSSAVVEIESLIGVEFETAEATRQRLDDTPLAQRVREADAREARREAGEEADDASAASDDEEGAAEDGRGFAATEARKLTLTATGPHPLLRGVRTLELETDYDTEQWSLRIPYDGFVLTLARTSEGQGALYEQRLGAGTILLSSGGSLFTNRALGQADNARLFANIVRAHVAPQGHVWFDDLRQGLSASYDPARFYRDPRLYKTVFILVALWLVWVLGSTRLRAPAPVARDPSEAELVRRAGLLIARTVPPHLAAMTLFDQFFATVARAARGAGREEAERGELWNWLERHAAIRPQELDQLKSWYADAHSARALPLVPLQNLLDTLGKRIVT